jgi:hypothetical protein
MKLKTADRVVAWVLGASVVAVPILLLADRLAGGDSFGL